MQRQLIRLSILRTVHFRVPLLLLTPVQLAFMRALTLTDLRYAAVWDVIAERSCPVLNHRCQ